MAGYLSRRSDSMAPPRDQGQSPQPARTFSDRLLGSNWVELKAASGRRPVTILSLQVTCVTARTDVPLQSPQDSCTVLSMSQCAARAILIITKEMEGTATSVAKHRIELSCALAEGHEGRHHDAANSMQWEASASARPTLLRHETD